MGTYVRGHKALNATGGNKQREADGYFLSVPLGGAGGRFLASVAFLAFCASALPDEFFFGFRSPMILWTPAPTWEGRVRREKGEKTLNGPVQIDSVQGCGGGHRHSILGFDLLPFQIK